MEGAAIFKLNPFMRSGAHHSGFSSHIQVPQSPQDCSQACEGSYVISVSQDWRSTFFRSARSSRRNAVLFRGLGKFGRCGVTGLKLGIGADKSHRHSRCHMQMDATSGQGKAASTDGATSPHKLEVTYDPHGRYHELASDLSSAGSFGSLTLFSPSKINVFLRITNKRSDGYHDLASLFHVISLGDVIKFSISPSKTKDSLTTNVAGVPLDDRNLVIKALNLYRQKTGSSNFFWIHLDKRVPTGAGLGGGSGNAATALWAANQLNGALVTEKELQKWSGEIGSDIPFFFSRGAAYCTGRGEIVQDIPMPIPLSTPMVLIKPKEACPTREVYKRFRLENASSVDPKQLLSQIRQNGISQDVCINDLERPAFEVLPSLKTLKQRITAASQGRYNAVFMSGSGSTIVGIGDNEPPQFLYDEEQYEDIFISEAYFLSRKENEWYKQLESAEIP